MPWGMNGLTVSQLARLAGVSVRTLHHYDERGLLRPSGRSSGGYRLYQRPPLQRLQQVRFDRALGLPLAEICRIRQSPGFDVLAALIHQSRARGAGGVSARGDPRERRRLTGSQAP